MSDTYTGECKVCGEETDLIEGICGNCFEEDVVSEAEIANLHSDNS